ncbi:pre-mRNA-splicing ATP-dependent RNA helicase prp28 [Acrasis kona]|uniref:Pre-mRNA-splicing ATP-dependent RNA helicase prp28 n=1 Tax=Acrasis kona TaxID=1008807 RepID=A0AAW2YVA9_9EUKA
MDKPNDSVNDEASSEQSELKNHFENVINRLMEKLNKSDRTAKLQDQAILQQKKNEKLLKTEKEALEKTIAALNEQIDKQKEESLASAAIVNKLTFENGELIKKCVVMAEEINRLSKEASASAGTIKKLNKIINTHEALDKRETYSDKKYQDIINHADASSDQSESATAADHPQGPVDSTVDPLAPKSKTNPPTPRPKVIIFTATLNEPENNPETETSKTAPKAPIGTSHKKTMDPLIIAKLQDRGKKLCGNIIDISKCKIRRYGAPLHFGCIDDQQLITLDNLWVLELEPEKLQEVLKQEDISDLLKEYMVNNPYIYAIMPNRKDCLRHVRPTTVYFARMFCKKQKENDFVDEIALVNYDLTYLVKVDSDFIEIELEKYVAITKIFDGYNHRIGKTSRDFAGYSVYTAGVPPYGVPLNNNAGTPPKNLKRKKSTNTSSASKKKRTTNGNPVNDENSDVVSDSGEDE